MNNSPLRQKAIILRGLHTSGPLLVLPNAWDPFSALVFQKKGFPALATSSAAISAVFGYQDGELMRKETHLDQIRRIAGAVDIPVTADIEAGYGESDSELEETIHQVIDAGVAGINLEDSIGGGGPLRPIEAQSRRIALARKCADHRGIPLVINARIDAYYSSAFTDNATALVNSVDRAKAYVAAGADCVYPMGPGDEGTVRLLRQMIPAPLNILAQPTAISLRHLESIGVNRVTFGPYLFRSCARQLTRMAEVLVSKGEYACFSDMLTRAEAREFLLEGPEKATR